MNEASRERVRRHRESLRKQGLRPVQIWVPDTSAPGFAEEARRQALAANAADEEDRVMEWIEAVSVFDHPDETW